ncbi:MAG: HAMP domain-containing histidine kinase [Cyclobacteriaceae bacterium]|nr:HAMP domain-containing histidine kinase [Cyclobacteriaceae bacterium]
MSIKNHWMKSSVSRLVMVINAGIILLAGYTVFQTYWYSLENSEKLVIEKLKGVANTAALQIGAKDHQYLTQMYKQKDGINAMNAKSDSIYLLIHNKLQSTQRVNGLHSPVYTMVYDSTSRAFALIATSSPDPYFRHPYTMFPEELIDNYNTGGVLGIHESENGKWLSAFSPIKDERGRVIALLQVDENFDEFVTDARTELFINLCFSLVAIIPFISFLMWYVRKTAKKEELVKEMLQEQNEEIQTQNEKIVKVNQKLEEARNTIEKKNEELDERVKERTRELSKANRDLGTFLYRSSHDIQGPLTSLLGLSNLMKSDHLSPKEFSGMLEDNVKILLSRIKSINRIYEIKTKELSEEHIESQVLADELMCYMENNCVGLGIDLTVEVKRNFTFLVKDKELLSYCLEELIDNSILYRREVSPFIKITIGKNENQQVIISIKDNGQGIPEEHSGRIFRMFQRLNNNSQGSGLGLYCVKLAMKRIQGDIQLQKSSSEGTDFEINLESHSPSRKEGNLSRYTSRAEKSRVK